MSKFVVSDDAVALTYKGEVRNVQIKEVVMKPKGKKVEPYLRVFDIDKGLDRTFQISGVRL